MNKTARERLLELGFEATNMKHLYVYYVDEDKYDLYFFEDRSYQIVNERGYTFAIGLELVEVFADYLKEM